MALVLGSFALNGGLYGGLLSRYAEIADAVHAGSTAFGTALAIAAVGGLLGSVLAPVLVRIARDVGAVTLFGCAFAVLAVTVAAAPNLRLLAVALFVMTFVDGGQDVSMNALAVRVQQAYGRSIMGRAHAVWSFSLSAGTAVGAGAAWLRVPVLAHVGVVAAVVVTLQLGAWWHGRDVPAADVVPAAHADRQPGRREIQGKVRALLVILAVAAIAASYVESPGQEWTALLLRRGFDASPGLAATGPLMFSLGLLVARLLLDPLTRHVRKSVIARVAGATVAAGTLLGLLVSARSGSVGQALGFIALAGLGAGSVFPLLFGGAEILSGRYSVAPATTTSVVSGLSRVGAITAPAVVGVLTGRSSIFMVFAVIAAGGIGVAVTLPRALRAGERT
jgi:hypothetical protein